jgi:hypothetical protein
MQIPVLNGIYTDAVSDFRVSYPRNLVPVPVQQGISAGYLRPADGIVAEGDTGPGPTRAGIRWNDVLYRLMRSKLVSIDSSGTITELGTVSGTTGQETMDYSFDHLAMSANGAFYLYDGITLQQVTDADLGTVIDFIWVDGYFMTTDGTYLVVTELSDPFSVLPTKYGSSEVDPDPVQALLKLDNEPHAVNRYTIEVFDNIGGTGFPFQRISGAMIERGAIGTHACCVFFDSIAFVGGGRNESISVWLGRNGNSVRIATREIDTVLSGYTEAELAAVLVESRVDKGHQHLLIHLPDQTLVYDAAASQVVGEPVWFSLSSGTDPNVDVTYNARNLVWCYDKWLVGDTDNGRVGYLSDAVSEHWGSQVAWQFGTMILYNEGNGALVHELELVALTGHAALGTDSTIWTEYSDDGVTWSIPKSVQAGTRGQRTKRLVWLGQGALRHIRMQRFHGTSDARASFARLEARLEGLAV